MRETDSPAPGLCTSSKSPESISARPATGTRPVVGRAVVLLYGPRQYPKGGSSRDRRTSNAVARGECTHISRWWQPRLRVRSRGRPCSHRARAPGNEVVPSHLGGTREHGGNAPAAAETSWIGSTADPRKEPRNWTAGSIAWATRRRRRELGWKSNTPLEVAGALLGLEKGDAVTDRYHDVVCPCSTEVQRRPRGTGCSRSKEAACDRLVGRRRQHRRTRRVADNSISSWRSALRSSGRNRGSPRAGRRCVARRPVRRPDERRPAYPPRNLHVGSEAVRAPPISRQGTRVHWPLRDSRLLFSRGGERVVEPRVSDAPTDSKSGCVLGPRAVTKTASITKRSTGTRDTLLSVAAHARVLRSARSRPCSESLRRRLVPRHRLDRVILEALLSSSRRSVVPLRRRRRADKAIARHCTVPPGRQSHIAVGRRLLFERNFATCRLHSGRSADRLADLPPSQKRRSGSRKDPMQGFCKSCKSAAPASSTRTSRALLPRRDSCRRITR